MNVSSVCLGLQCSEAPHEENSAAAASSIAIANQFKYAAANLPFSLTTSACTHHGPSALAVDALSCTMCYFQLLPTHVDCIHEQLNVHFCSLLHYPYVAQINVTVNKEIHKLNQTIDR
jgi:hypothetical protein